MTWTSRPPTRADADAVVALVCAVDDVKNAGAVAAAFQKLPEVQKVLASGPAKRRLARIDS